jgi:hypothetical protein
LKSALFLALAAFCALPARADLVTIYTVGSNPAGNAQNGSGVNIGGVPIITWTNIADAAGPAILTIIAEGVDSPNPETGGTGERDEVFFNSVSIGFLTQQGFYANSFRLNPGPGALTDITALSASVFNVIALAGANTVSVHVDPNNWVDEIETASLASGVPEPTSISLIGFGLVACELLRRRRAR